MLARWIRPIRFLIEGIVAADTPRQLALGLALGMLIGLVPKGNLTALMLSMILLGTRVNLATGMLGAGLFTWLSTWTDPLAHRLGYAVLTWKPLQGTFAWLFDWPLIPWTALNNTVVFGSLLLGLWLFWPTCHLGTRGFTWLQPRIAQLLERYRLTTVLAGTELAAKWRSR